MREPRFANPTAARILMALVLVGAAHGVLGAPRGFDYDAEHLFESAIDARHLSLPWTVGRPAAGKWSTTVAAGYASTGNDLARLEGPMLALGVRYGVSDHRAIEALLFADRLEVSGDGGPDLWRPAVLDLGDEGPWAARFTDLDGSVESSGIGIGGIWQRDSARCPACGRTLRAGVIWERLDVGSYTAVITFDEGPDVGTSARLDLSGSYDFLVPYLAVETARPLGRRFTISPHLSVLMPLPRQVMEVRLTRSGRTDEGGTRGAPVGDGIVGLGLRLDHPASGLSIDLGSSLYYALAERVFHPGVDRAITLHLGWHAGRPERD